MYASIIFPSPPSPATRQYKEVFEKYKSMALQVKSLNSFIRTLNQSMTDRLKDYTQLKRWAPLLYVEVEVRGPLTKPQCDNNQRWSTWTKLS